MTDSTLRTNLEGSLAEPLSLAASSGVQPKSRVLIYGINYAPEPIGVGRYTGEIGTYLIKQGVNVEVITAVPHYPGWSLRSGYANWYSVEGEAGARVTRCPLLLRHKMHGIWRFLAPLSFALLAAPVFLWRMIMVRPDVVLCVEPTLFVAPMAIIARKLFGSRLVLHVQDLEIDAAFAVGHLGNNWFKAIAFRFERWILGAFDSIVTISARMRERLQAKGVAAERLHMVRNWVDLDQIKPLNRPSIFRAELGVTNETFVALYAGNIGPKQALPLFLEAAVRLRNKSEILFVIAGEGPEKAALLSKYGASPNVRFIPLQPEEKLCELLGFADIHVLPQLRGTADLVLPSKLGGMLASGKPCIVMADDKTELQEFLGNAAIVTPAGDSDALAEAILHVASGAIPFRADLQLMLAEKLCARTSLASLALVLFQQFSAQSKSANSATGAAYEI